MIDTKQAASLTTSVGSFIIGDRMASIMTMHEQITFFLQNAAFVVSIAAGLITIYYTIKKHCHGKNSAN